MSLNQKKISRSVFNFWDVISDVGGFYGVLVSVCASIISVLTYQKPVKYLSSQLFWGPESNNSDPQIETRMRLKAKK